MAGLALEQDQTGSPRATFDGTDMTGGHTPLPGFGYSQRHPASLRPLRRFEDCHHYHPESAFAFTDCQRSSDFA
jgi:hypothetical protein